MENYVKPLRLRIQGLFLCRNPINTLLVGLVSKYNPAGGLYLSTNHGGLVDIERAIEKIGNQFPHTPEANLCLAIIDRAFKDLTDPQVTQNDKQDAMDYLSGDIVHAQVYGVHPAMVKSILAEASVMPSEWDLAKRGIVID